MHGNAPPPGPGAPPPNGFAPPAQSYPGAPAPQGGYGAPPSGGYGQAPPPAGGFGHPQPGQYPQPYGFGPPQPFTPGAWSGQGCPKCGSGNTYHPTFTWWGGMIGPAILNHQVCNGCGFGYNGKTGRSNGTAIGIYFGVVFAIAIFLFIVRVALG
jgi:hypothetical protein